MNLYAVLNNRKTDLNIKWRLTDWCNYHCSYCVRRDNGLKIQSPPNEDYLCQVAARLNEILKASDKKCVKIDLIGGEVSVFDLGRILDNITVESLKHVNLTTNFFRNAEYYVGLYERLKSRGIKLTLTASFHPEYEDFRKFILKAQVVNEFIGKDFKVEMVATKQTEQYLDIFTDMCTQYGIKYSIDVDIRFGQEDVRSKCCDYSTSSKTTKRYSVIYEDGSKEEFTTRNQFLVNNKTPQNHDSNSIFSRGYYCSHSYDYIYLIEDKVYGKITGSDNPNSCTGCSSIEDFQLLKEPTQCPHDACTLCGSISVSKDKKTLIDNVKMEENND